MSPPHELITAKPWAFLRFAATVAHGLGVLSPEQTERYESYYGRSPSEP